MTSLGLIEASSRKSPQPTSLAVNDEHGIQLPPDNSFLLIFSLFQRPDVHVVPLSLQSGVSIVQIPEMNGIPLYPASVEPPQNIPYMIIGQEMRTNQNGERLPVHVLTVNLPDNAGMMKLPEGGGWEVQSGDEFIASLAIPIRENDSQSSFNAHINGARVSISTVPNPMDRNHGFQCVLIEEDQGKERVWSIPMVKKPTDRMNIQTTFAYEAQPGTIEIVGTNGMGPHGKKKQKTVVIKNGDNLPLGMVDFASDLADRRERFFASTKQFIDAVKNKAKKVAEQVIINQTETPDISRTTEYSTEENDGQWNNWNPDHKSAPPLNSGGDEASFSDYRGLGEVNPDSGSYSYLKDPIDVGYDSVSNSGGGGGEGATHSDIGFGDTNRQG